MSEQAGDLVPDKDAGLLSQFGVLHYIAGNSDHASIASSCGLATHSDAVGSAHERKALKSVTISHFVQVRRLACKGTDHGCQRCARIGRKV